MKKKTLNKKLLCVSIILNLIAIVILLFSSILSSTDIVAVAYENYSIEDFQQNNKIKEEAILNQDFKDDRVIVTLKKEYSIINKIVYIDDFKLGTENHNLGKITDLFYVNNLKNNNLVNKEKFSQILSIELIEKGKVKVIEAIKLLNKSNIVHAVEPDYIYNSVANVVPNDTNYSSFQWGLNGNNGIEAESAWDFSTGDTNVIVGLFETGAQQNHEDLDGRFLTPNFTLGNTSHGTHVAGIIGAISNNSKGIAGIAQVSMVLLDRNNFVDSLTFATNNNVDIINASFYYSRSESDIQPAEPNNSHAAAIANYKGLLICSAGNSSADTDTAPQYPSGYGDSRKYPNINNILSVGATSNTGNRASFSNFGLNSVHIFAPGELIYSTLPNNTYGYDSGTSMAAPHVTGVAALILSHYKYMTYDLTKAEISAKIKSAIMDSVIPDSRLTNLCVSGGRLNAYEALKRCLFDVTNINDDEVRIDGTDFTLAHTLTIPATLNGRDVTEIADYAFTYKNMVSVAFEDQSKITSIGTSAFFNCKFLSHFPLPVNITTIESATFAIVGEDDIQALIFGTNNATLTTIGYGAFINRLLFTNPIAPSVTTIDEFAFDGCELPDEFFLPAGSQLITIGKNAFSDTNLTSFVIPNYVTNIGYSAFANCNNLTIYTERSSRPTTWHTDWNSSNRPVVWGCTLSTDKTYVVSFNKTTSNPSNASATNGISAPIRKGYDFGGWYTTSDFSGTQYMDLATAPNGTLYAKWTDSSCVAEGSLITLADGSQKAVEDLTGDEMLLVWNMFTGTFDVAPILFIDSDSYSQYEIIHLYFSDGTEVKVIDEHGFWDINLNEYVFLRNDSAQYIGHWFNKQTYDENNEMTWTAVQLIGVEIYTQYTTAWSPVTYGHLCYYVNGMLTMPGATEGLINIFEVDETTMRYDTELYLEDIEEYGLFTYEEFAEMISVPEVIFNAFNGQYLKVSIGKGLIDIDGIIELVERYAPFFEEE